MHILSKSKMRSITVCDRFALFLTASNSIIKLDLCSDGGYTVLEDFTKIENKLSGDSVKLLKCSNCLTVVVTNFGFVYNVPNRINNERLDVQEMSVGQEHCLLLLTDGSVLSFGSGRFGQLGHGDLEDVQTPKPIEALLGIDIVSISCGYWHSFALSKEGDLYSWGCNKYGQLGQPLIESGIQTLPIPIDLDSCDFHGNPVIIKCGAKHSLVLLDGGQLIGCGWNKYGQLGLDNRTECVRKMTAIFQLPNYRPGFVSLQCGPWSSFVMSR